MRKPAEPVRIRVVDVKEAEGTSTQCAPVDRRVDRRPTDRPEGPKLEVRPGRVPDGAVELARVTLRASAPAPLAAYEAVLRGEASKRCASGVALVRAVEADGSGVVEVVAALWAAPVAP